MYIVHATPSRNAFPSQSIVMLPSAIQIICNFAAYFSAPKAFLIYLGSSTYLQSVYLAVPVIFQEPLEGIPGMVRHYVRP